MKILAINHMNRSIALGALLFGDEHRAGRTHTASRQGSAWQRAKRAGEMNRRAAAYKPTGDRDGSGLARARGARCPADPQARILVEHIEVILERLEEAEADLCTPRWRRCAAPCGSPLQSMLFALVPSVLTRLAGRHPPLRVEIAQQDAGPAFAGLLAHERMRRKPRQRRRQRNRRQYAHKLQMRRQQLES